MISAIIFVRIIISCLNTYSNENILVLEEATVTLRENSINEDTYNIINLVEIKDISNSINSEIKIDIPTVIATPININ